MMRLEDLTPNTSIRGIVPDQAVTVVNAQWFGSEALELTYKDQSGKVANELLYRYDESRIELVDLPTVTSIVAAAQLSHGHRAPAEPKFPLRRAACKDHMREFLNFFPQCFVGCLPNARSTITFASSDRNQDVLLHPLAFLEHLTQLRKIDLKLSGPMRQRGAIILNIWISTFAEPD